MKRNTKGRQQGKSGNPALKMNTEQNLPLAGSGKMPWLRLLMTEDLGESWLLCPDVLGECPLETLAECWRPWPECERRWCSPSHCSFSGSQRGTLSSWAVLDRSISTYSMQQNLITWCWDELVWMCDCVYKMSDFPPLLRSHWRSTCHSPIHWPLMSSSSAKYMYTHRTENISFIYQTQISH